MEDKFTIGQMSKLYNIPVKTLRYYDQIGLFTPFKVDEKTGYRYYRSEQFKKLDMIRFLKKMGVPLKEIKKKVEHSTIDEFIEILTDYERVSEQKMRELIQINNHLNAKIAELKEAKQLSRLNELIIRKVPERRIIAFQEQLQPRPDDIEEVLHYLRKEFGHLTPIMVGQVGMMLSVEQITNSDVEEYTGVYILVDDEFEMEHERVDRLPEGLYATVYTRKRGHNGVAYYRKLITDLHDRGYDVEGSFLKREIVDSFISHHPKEQLQEIQIRLKPLSSE